MFYLCKTLETTQTLATTHTDTLMARAGISCYSLCNAVPTAAIPPLPPKGCVVICEVAFNMHSSKQECCSGRCGGDVPAVRYRDRHVWRWRQ